MTSTSVVRYQTPPGPDIAWWGLPLMGDLLKEPLGTVQKFQAQYGDVLHLRVLNQHFYYLFAPELIREALIEHPDDVIRHPRPIDVFTRVYGANVLTTEGQAWKRQRRILMPGFLPKKIAAYLDLMAVATDDNLAAWFPQVSGDSVVIDAASFTRKITVDVILNVLFGHKAAEADAVRALEATLTLEHQGMRELYWPATPPDWLPYPGRAAKLQAKAALQNLISRQISARRASRDDPASRNDYLGMLLSAQDEQAQGHAAATLSDEEIRDNCMVIFAAGHDTTATVLGWWLGLMALHPEHAERARQEIDAQLGMRNPAPEDLSGLAWLNATLKEAMRLYPPAPLLFVRRTTTDLTLGKWQIPQGANLTIPVWHVHHDARWFAEPEAFRPDRFMPAAPDIARGAYLPFGTGPRVCIGQHFAMMEMTLIATQLLRQFDFSLHDMSAMPKAKVEMVLTPETPLIIRFTRR